MKKWLLPVGLIYSSCLFAGDDWSMNNHWNFYGDYVCMGRKSGMIHNKGLVFERERNGLTAASDEVICGPLHCEEERLSTEHLLHELGQESGFRVGVVYMERTWSLEGSYLHANEWKSKSFVHGHHNLSYPFEKHDDSAMREAFSHASEAYGEYSSCFWTADLNYWRHVTPRRMDYFSFSWIAGVRYVLLDEETSTVFKKQNGQRSEYSIETKNHMPGPQVGLNIQVNPYRQWSWDFTGKIGGLLNCDQQKASVRNQETRFAGGSSHDFAGTLFINGSAALTWHFWRHANLHLGYEFFYMTGVALAVDRYKRTTSEHAIVTVKSPNQVCFYDAFGGISIGF